MGSKMVIGVVLTVNMSDGKTTTRALKIEDFVEKSAECIKSMANGTVKRMSAELQLICV